MSWLDDLLRNYGQNQWEKMGIHTGSWGTPELGLGELASDAFSLVGGGSLRNHQGGSQLFGAFTPQPVSAADTGQTVLRTLEEQQRQQQQPGTIQGTTTTGDGGGGGGGGGGGPSPEEIARREEQAKLQQIANRLQQMRDIAQRNIGQARGVRDEVVGNIGSTFANLLSQAQTRKQSALDTLGREDINVQNLYGRAEGTARRAMESALTKNRMAARAMGMLNSSFYEDRQAQTREAALKSVADLSQEQAYKRGEIGTRTTETEQWFEQQASNIEREEATLKSQAEREYQNQVNAALDMERAYGIDSLAAAEQAQNEFQSKLNQIDQYIQDKGFRLLEIAAATGQNIGGVINQFSAINDQLSRALGVNQGLGRAQGLGDTLPTFGGVTTAEQMTNYLPFYQQQGQTQNEDEERLRQLGLL